MMSLLHRALVALLLCLGLAVSASARPGDAGPDGRPGAHAPHPDLDDA